MPGRSCSANHDMINKVIKLKLQCFIHAYVQATCQTSCPTKGCDYLISKGRYDETFAGEDACQRDPEVYATCHDPKIYPHTKLYTDML